MAWLTEEEYRDEWVTLNATDIASATVEGALRSAKLKIKGLIQTDIYESVEDGDPAESDEIAAVLEAQGLLATRRLLLNRSLRFRNGGIVKTERDENNSVTNQYEDTKDNEVARKALYDEALDILGPYFTADVAEEVEPIVPRSAAVPVVADW